MNKKHAQKINILILSVGRRVELIRFIKETLCKNNIESKIFACDVDNTASALFFADHVFMVSPITNASYVDEIIKIAADNDVGAIIPTIDTELLPLAERRNEIIDKTGALINLSGKQTIEICRSKKKTAEFLVSHNFYTPKTYPGDVLFPAFIKPNSGSSSINAHLVKTGEELEFYQKIIPDAIVQEYIDGEEYTVDVFSDFDANPITIVPRKRLAVRGGEILKGYITKDREVIEQCKRLIKALSLWGHNTIQCIKSGGKIYFIEVNPRFGGGAPMSLRAGADSIMNLVRIRNGESLEYSEDYISDIFCARFDDSVFFDDNGERLYL